MLVVGVHHPVVVQMAVDILPFQLHAIGVDRDVRQNQIILLEHPNAVDFLESGLQQLLGRKDVVIPVDEPFKAIQALDTVQTALVHRHVAQMVDMVLGRHHRVPIVNNRLIVLLGRQPELATDQLAVVISELDDIGVGEVGIAYYENLSHRNSPISRKSAHIPDTPQDQGYPPTDDRISGTGTQSSTISELYFGRLCDFMHDGQMRLPFQVD